jgi:peroxiredoxin Q/BCP
MEVHDKVENFSLQNQDEQTVQLNDFAGKPVVLFFYPKADTPGCTIEACGFRDAFTQLENEGAVVLGISRDTPKAQKKFQQKYNLSYPLLADVDEEVCRQFDVLREKNMYGKKVIGIERTTFLIGPDRRLLKIFPKVKPEGHAEEVLKTIREYAKTHHV